MMKHVPEQSAPSAKQGGSARPVEESASSQKQARPAGSRRFTPAQQAVAAVLIVVVKRAMKDGRGFDFAVVALKFNNPTTMPFLGLLLEDGPLPTMKQLEHMASVQVLESLTELANECAAARCQPLEVFTRSLQCLARMEEPDWTVAELGAYDWQLRDQQCMPWAPSVSQAVVEDLILRGLRRSLAELAVTFLQVATVYRGDKEAAPWARMELNHMLPDRI